MPDESMEELGSKKLKIDDTAPTVLLTQKLQEKEAQHEEQKQEQTEPQHPKLIDYLAKRDGKEPFEEI